MKEKDENASVSSPVKRVMSLALSQRSLPMAGDLKNDSITGYNDELSDMTIGRRWARSLSSPSGCCCISDCYNPSHREQDEEEDTSKSEPSLDKAWEYFEHQTLPRCLAGGLSDSILGKYDRAEIGEHTKKTMLYPVWSTPMEDMADFGIGVGLYFSTLRFLAILSLFAACINIPNMFYFASEDYDAGRNGNQLDPCIAWPEWVASSCAVGVGIREKAKSWLLLGTAVCSNTQWEMCLRDCGEEYWKGESWQSFPGTTDRLATGSMDDLNITFLKRNICNIEETSKMYGPLIFSTVIIVMTAIYYWIYSQKKRIELFDNAEHSSTDYTIEINNPPKTDSSFSPDVWKKWFEVTFDDMEVAACTIALDNEQLIQALANRRSLIMKLQNELERPEDFDIDHMDDIVNHLDKMPKWKRSFCFAASPKRLVEAIKNQTAVISTLSEKDYAVASVFVTFQTQVQQKEVLGKLLVPAFCSRRKLDYKKYIYEGTILKVSEPAEPSAIHWWDLNVAAWKRSSKRFITTLISFAMILISVCVIGYLRSVSSALSGYAITVFNLITPKVVTMLTMLESHPNTSSFSASQYLKVTAFRWTNTVLINNVIIPFTDTLADDGLIKSIMVLFILELSLKPVLQYLDIWGALQRHFFAPRATHQRKMNLCFQSSAYDIGERSTNVTTILFFTLYYAAIFPCGFIFAFVIFSQMYWSDKYSILRQWRQGPKIGTSIAKMTNIFFLIAIAVYAILTFNFYAMFPFDNVCEDGSVDDEYLGTWNITSDAKDFDLKSIEITQNRSYTFCNQNILRKFTFPPTPAKLLSTSDAWLSDNRKNMATILGWFMILTVAIIISTIALKTIVQFIKYLFFADYKIQEMTEEKRSELEKLRFCDIEEIKAYVPQITIDGYTFPFLLCDVDEIDKEMIGWSNPEDPESNYDAHNLIFDIPKVADEKNAMREDPKIAALTNPADENSNAPLFSIVKSWKAVEKKTRENIEAGSRA
uniref:CSC1/OSCA1-like cytosolic domain-containing protein n=1 Tax=Chaetoceros debilis TaxID=122233 RepID=A0A7S3QJ10_9STRA